MTHTNLDFKKPSIELVPSYLKSLDEGITLGGVLEDTPEFRSQIKANPQSYIDELESMSRPQSRSYKTPTGHEFSYIPEHTFWLSEKNYFIGNVRIRTELTDDYLYTGGHIGYSVRESARGKGYGHYIFQKTIEWLRDNSDLDEIIITVEGFNAPSIAIIEKGGSEFLDKGKDPYEWGFDVIRYILRIER